MAIVDHPQWQLDLERAHDHLRRAALVLERHASGGVSGEPSDLRPAARALEGAHGALFDAFDARVPSLEATRAAASALDDTIALLAGAAAGDPAVAHALEELRAACPALGEADARLAPLFPRRVPPAPDLRASEGGVPVLHLLDRPSLQPRLRLPEPAQPEVTQTPVRPERPKTFAELEQAVQQLKARAQAQAKKTATATAGVSEPDAPPLPEPPFGFAEDVGAPLTEDAFVDKRVRDCFEDVTMIGTQRAPLLGDPWRFARVLERRILASVDAIVAMGPRALAALEPLVFDAPLRDPSRLFALTMVLGCVDGRDSLATAERAFLAFEPGDPQHAEHFGAALKLVPHPQVTMALRTLLADADPAHRALAIDVLGYRGDATEAELARAALDEPRVAAAALPFFALSRHPDLADAITRGLDSANPAHRDAARLALVLSGDRRAVTALREALSAPSADPADAAAKERAASLLALLAGPRDAELLLELAIQAPTRALVTAIGWAGSPAAVPALLGFLEHGDASVVVAAGYALDRLTNAGLFEDAVVEAEAIMVPDVPEPDMDLDDAAPSPLARVVSDPRDLPAEPAIETLRQPTTSAPRWQAYWNERGATYDVEARYRRGYPYTPLVSWRELDLFACTPGERRLLQIELVARTGGTVRFDPHDFVPVQEAAIAAWEPIARRASGQPGSWALPLRR